VLLTALVVATGLTTFLLVEAGERDQAIATASDATLPATGDGEAPTTLEEEEEIEPIKEELQPTDRAAPTWTIQPGARLAFSVGNGGDTVRGSFAQWTGGIRFDPDDPDDAEIR